MAWVHECQPQFLVLTLNFFSVVGFSLSWAIVNTIYMMIVQMFAFFCLKTDVHSNQILAIPIPDFNQEQKQSFSIILKGQRVRFKKFTGFLGTLSQKRSWNFERKGQAEEEIYLYK